MKVLNNFYTKIGMKSFAILFIVYSFVMCSFYWGNHDWSYLKNGISAFDSLFEARYSLHFFNILFLEGHILPVYTVFLSLIGVVMLGIVSGIYLGLEKRTKEFLLFVLMIGLFPYGFIVFYYLFIAVSLNWWAVFGVLLLFLTETPFKISNFGLGSLGYALLIGSYPPNIALVLVLFLGKQIIELVLNDEKIKNIVLKSIFFIGQFLIGYILFKMLFIFLSKNNFLSDDMYNVKVNNLSDMLGRIPLELLNSFKALFLLKSELGISGSIFLIITVLFGVWRILTRAKNKLISIVLLAMVFVASRFMYIVSYASDLASFRGGYWGILGILMVFLAFLCMEQKQYIKNCIYLFEIVFLVIFVNTNFEVQKTMNFIFDSEIKFHERLKKRVEEHDNFDSNNTYVSWMLGSPEYNRHFCVMGCNGYNNEILSSITMNMDLIPLLFFDDEYRIDTKLGAWNNLVWNVKDGKYINLKEKNIKNISKEDKENIKFWLYHDVEAWPSINSLYIDKRHIFVILDDKKNYLYGKHLFELLNY